MKRLILLLTIAAFFQSGCSKIKDAVSGEYYFKYTVNGKSGGSSANIDLLGLNPAQSYTALASSSAVLMASKLIDCNVNGNNPCYNALISLQNLSVGNHSFSTNGNILLLTENQSSSTEKKYWISVPDGIGGGTVTLTEVGGIGGAVVGTFTGKAGLEGSSSFVQISGNFRLRRTF